MEKKEEPKECVQNKKKKNDISNKDESIKNINNNISENVKEKKANQFQKLELNNEHFQIIQEKINEQKINKEKNQPKDKIDQHKALSDKNIINFKNENNNNSIQNNFKEIKETTKKSRSQENKESNYIYNDNNQNVYALLNSYYKDTDLKLKEKDSNINNPGKNFLLKNQFKEKKKDISTNDPKYYYPVFPYLYYQNPFMYNNPNMYYKNDQSSSYSIPIPENVFNINSQINYNYSNNINYYNYNYQRSNYKQRKKYNFENNEYKLYVINIENIIKGVENRTTVMIRHIPNKYTYKNLQEEIDPVCKNKYDFLYLPLDSGNDCNLGYAFINFINPLHIVHFYFTFKSRRWLYFNSLKECDLTYAKFQGTEFISNFEKNMNKTDDKRRIPMVFEIKNPPKIDLPKKYFEMIKEYKADSVNDINWI